MLKRSISIYKSRLFSQISGDRNKIHLQKEISKNFFFKNPIVHGVNISIIALVDFLKNSNSKKKIEYLNIIFKNFCLVNEKFFIKFKKEEINIENDIHQKVNIQIRLKKNNENNQRGVNLKYKKIINYYKLSKNEYFFLGLIEHLLKVSKYIGNLDNDNKNLIHNIKLNKVNKKKTNFFKKKKITKNVFLNIYRDDQFISEIISSKLVSLKIDKKKFVLSKSILKKLDDKKIIIFGSSSDLSYATNLFLKGSKAKIYKFSLNFNLKKKINLLNQFLLRIKPDFIFFFCSPKINIENNKNKTLLFYYYNEVYFNKFKLLLNSIKSNNLTTLVFFPSSEFLNDKKNFLNYKSYMKAKEKAEKLIMKNKYKNIAKFYRLPKFKTRATYNILGHYEGEDLHFLRKYLETFFKQSINLN
jgi:hypothetical protein